MTAILNILAVFGWRGALGAGLGAALMAAPAYHAGKWVEDAATEARIGRAIAEFTLAEMEKHDERIEAAMAARRRSQRAVPDGANGQRMPDDGFRRD